MNITFMHWADLFSVNSKQIRVSLEEGPSVEEPSPSHWPTVCLWGIFLINYRCGRTQLPVDSTKQVVLGRIRKQVEQAMGSQPVAS